MGIYAESAPGASPTGHLGIMPRHFMQLMGMLSNCNGFLDTVPLSPKLTAFSEVQKLESHVQYPALNLA